MSADYQNYQNIRVEFSGRLATVTLNRPEVRNAFQPAMMQELTQAFRSLAQRMNLSVILLRGEGKSFCSGADLGYMKSMISFSIEQNTADSEQLHEMFWTIRECPHMLVGRFHGHVMGGGVGLASLCDIGASVEGTQFCFSEVRLGLAPSVISPFVLEKMSMSHARRYMLSGEVFGPTEAFNSGLIQFKGDEASVDDFLSRLLLGVQNNGPEAVRATKDLLRKLSATPDWEARRELTTKLIAERRVSAEGQEGLKSFFEKREPGWRAKT